MKPEAQTSPIATITVANAELLASHDARTAQEFCDEILRLADQDAIKAIVVRVEPSPSADARAQPPANAGAAAAPQRAYLGPAGLYQTLVFCKKPVIAQLHGPIGPMGALIGLYADLAVADIDSAFPSPFDLVPEANFMIAALTMRLDRAKAWLLDAEPLTVAEAEEIGLVNVAVPRGEVEARALDLAQRAAAMPLDGITVSKMNLNACLDAMGVGQDFDLAGFFGAGMQMPSMLGGT